MSIDFILCVASFLSRIPLGHGESSLVLVEDFRERRGASKSLVVTAEDIRKRVAHASSNVQVFAFEYFPHALTDEGRVMPVFEAGSDPTCDAFKQKLLGSGDSGRRKAIEGSSSAKDRVAGASAGGVSGASRASKAAGAAPSRRKANKHTRALARAKDAALEAVRASSRETLLAKPPKALRELLTDLGAMCRGCLDKAKIVDRLQEVAGVAGRAEL